MSHTRGRNLCWAWKLLWSLCQAAPFTKKIYNYIEWLIHFCRCHPCLFVCLSPPLGLSCLYYFTSVPCLNVSVQYQYFQSPLHGKYLLKSYWCLQTWEAKYQTTRTSDKTCLDKIPEGERMPQSPFSNQEAICSCYMLRMGKSVFTKGVSVGIWTIL